MLQLRRGSSRRFGDRGCPSRASRTRPGSRRKTPDSCDTGRRGGELAAPAKSGRVRTPSRSIQDRSTARLTSSARTSASSRSRAPLAVSSSSFRREPIARHALPMSRQTSPCLRAIGEVWSLVILTAKRRSVEADVSLVAPRDQPETRDHRHDEARPLCAARGEVRRLRRSCHGAREGAHRPE